jgi:hypothetical protein
VTFLRHNFDAHLLAWGLAFGAVAIATGAMLTVRYIDSRRTARKAAKRRHPAAARLFAVDATIAEAYINTSAALRPLPLALTDDREFELCVAVLDLRRYEREFTDEQQGQRVKGMEREMERRVVWGRVR